MMEGWRVVRHADRGRESGERCSAYEEQRQCIERQTQGVVDEAIEPNFGVFESLGHVAPCEGFVLRRVAVFLESGIHKSLLVLREEV